MWQPSTLNPENGNTGAGGAGVRVGFWRRQFGSDVTTKQVIFDAVFGALLPVFCFVCDPVVFRAGGLMGRPFLGELQLVAYATAFLEITVLLIWLTRRERVGAYALTLGGILMAGAFVSFSIGIVLLPLSLIGIFFFGIGLLGFIPFLTGMVFLRNGWRAVHARDELPSEGRACGALLLGMVFAVGGPGAAQLATTREASQSLAELMGGSPHEAAEAVERLKLISYLTDTGTDAIRRAYWSEQDLARRKRLAEAYEAITGSDVDKQSVLMD